MVTCVIRADSAVGIFPEAPTGYTAPGVAEAIVRDGQITISPLVGESFGTADITHRLFEDFRDQSNGAPPSSAAVAGTGSFTQTDGVIETALGIMSDRSWHHEINGQILRPDFGLTADGVRVSYYIHSPLSDAQIAGGRFKMCWIEEGNGSGAQFDLSTPSKQSGGTTAWGLVGNNFNLVNSSGQQQVGIGPILPANEWVRNMFSMSRTLGWRWVTCCPTHGFKRRQDSNNVLEQGTTNEVVNNIYFGATADTPFNLGCIQIHSGLGCNASIELGDAENYDDCEHLYDCDINSWGSTITATVRLPPNELETTTLWLHGHTADREHFNASRNGRLVSLT